MIDFSIWTYLPPTLVSTRSLHQKAARTSAQFTAGQTHQNATKEERAAEMERNGNKKERRGGKRKHNVKCRPVWKEGTRTRGKRSGVGRKERRCRRRRRGEDRVLLFLTHIEQCLQHRSAIAPASLRDPRSAAQLPLQSELQCAATAQWQQPHLSNTVSTM